MSDHQGRLLDARIDARLTELRQGTASRPHDAAFVDRVMARVQLEPEFLWLSRENTRRGLWVCSALVVISLVWARKTEEVATSALLAASVPKEGASW